MQKLIEEYAKALGKSNATIDAYTRAIRQWINWLAQQTPHRKAVRIEHLTRPALEMYLVELEHQNYSVSHRARMKAAVSSFAQWLIQQNLLEQNPADGIEIPVQAVRAPRRLDIAQRLILRELVEGSDDPRGQALFAMGYWVGCRVSDASWLRMEDTHINSRVGRIRVGHKGNKWREIDLVNAARRPLALYLQDYRHHRQCPFVFTSQRGGRLTEAGIHHWWRQIRASAPHEDWERICNITFHDLRHDFAHRAREAGWTLEELAFYLGHITRQGTPAIQSTARYTQVGREDVKAKLKLLKG